MKRNNATHLLALLLSFIMVFSVTACGNKAKETQNRGNTGTQGGENTSVDEPVLLRIFMYDKASADDKAVAEYINSLPQVQALNVTIEIIKQPSGGYYEKIPLLLLTGNEQMDIGFDGTSFFTNRMQQGAYADISEYLAKDQDFYKSFPESIWGGVKYQGGVYGVPTYKDYTIQWAFVTDSQIIEKHNIDPASITDFQDIEVILEAEKQDGGYSPFIVAGGMWNGIYKTAMLDEYDLVNSLNYAVVDRKDGKTVVNPFETEEFIELVHTMYDWNQKGYIHPDALTSTSPGKDFTTGGLKSGTTMTSTGGIDVVYDAFALSERGWEGVVTMPVTGTPSITSNSTRGSLFGIYEKCKNKDQAYEFLKLWNTDPEVKNAIYLGIPDRHYTVVDGKARRVDRWEELYHSRNWTTGNNVIGMLTVDEEDGMWEEYQKNAQSARETEELGMVLNSDTIMDKQAIITSVLSEYMPPLLLGYVEPESGIAKLNEQLKASGLDEVIAEIQSQYDAFRASK